MSRPTDTWVWGQFKMKAYQVTRAYLLDELRHTRARLRIGTTSEANGRKDRRYFQRELFKLRQTRKAS